MKALRTDTLLIAVITLTLKLGELARAKRILIVTPHPSYGRQTVYRALCLALRERGHEIVSATPNPLNNSTLTDYTEVDLSFAYDATETDEPAYDRWPLSAFDPQPDGWRKAHSLTERVLSDPEFEKLYADGSREKFDAVIVELETYPALYALSWSLEAPLIGIKADEIENHLRFTTGSPILPSHPSNWELADGTGARLPLHRRVANFARTWWKVCLWFGPHVRRQREIAVKHFGRDVPHVNDLANGMSLILMNRPLALSPPRPELPNVVYFSGMQISRNPPALPANLKRFLDNAKRGFVYIRFDGAACAPKLPARTLDVLNGAFSNLTHDVLWVREQDELQNGTGNMFVSKWVPQQSVLAHPNIKLFVYQGGLRSTEEAVHYAVPLVGIPCAPDQKLIIGRVASLGIGKRVNVDSVTEERVRVAVKEVVSRKRYKQNVREISIVFKDKPLDNLWNAVWWIEYVIRNEGTPYFRYSAADEPWYQRQDMDVVTIIALGALAMVYASLLICWRCLAAAGKRVVAYARSFRKDKRD